MRLTYRHKQLIQRLLPAEALLRVWFSLRRFDREPSVLVYQYGKVGSSSVCASLRAAGLRNVFQVHTLNPERWRTAVDRHRSFGAYVPRHLIVSKCVMRALDAQRLQRPLVITLVREPIAQAVSSFFENLHIAHPGLAARRLYDPEACLSGAREELRDLQSIVASREQWFADELSHVFDVDVFREDFPVSLGSRTYESERATVLVVRLENLSDCFEKAMAEVLPGRAFRLVESNVGYRKEYRQAYRHVLDNLRIPEEELRQVCDSRFVRHFYSDMVPSVLDWSAGRRVPKGANPPPSDGKVLNQT